jgi:membrane-associated phospholipid phosphatase
MNIRVDFYYLKVLLRLAFLLLLFLMPVFLFGLIIYEVLIERGGQFDAIIFQFLAAHSQDNVTKFLSFITFFGSVRFLVAAYTLLGFWLLLKRKIVLALNIAAIGFSSFFILRLIKVFIDRSRPSDPLIDTLHVKYSFPSGHASSSLIFAGLLIYLLWQKPGDYKVKYIISLLLLLLSFLIGLSRIYLRMHYASDVLAGFCLGWIWINFSILFLLFSRSSRNQLLKKLN